MNAVTKYRIRNRVYYALRFPFAAIIAIPVAFVGWLAVTHELAGRRK